MTFFYTIRGRFDKSDGISWDKYIEWSRLTHLKELVSLDGMLNEVLVEPDHGNTEDWANIVVDHPYETGFFKTLDYVFQRSKKKEKFNLLIVVIEPEQDCKYVDLEDYQFIGYDLLDQDYSISALTNCGGFDETFLPAELNTFGLIDDYDKAFDVKKRLRKNNPDEHHAETNVIAVWRHKKIGQ